MPKLTDDELDAFLDEREHRARIATVDDDEFPRVLPLWFIREGSRLLFTPRALCAVDLAADTTRLSTWRMPVAGEDRRGVWAKRYYVPGSKWSDT